MTQEGDHTEDDIALVGEYALYLLDTDDRLAFEARLAKEPALQALLRDWDEGLLSLSDEVSPVTPPPRVKTAIDARLFGQETRRWSLRAMLAGPRGVLGMAFVAALFVFVGPLLRSPPEQPIYIAEIAAEDRALVVDVTFDPDTAEIAFDRTQGAALDGRVLELWLIAEGASAPVSLGVMPDAQRATILVPQSLRAGMIGATLAISDEPLGGSPTGAPTGDVLAVGVVILI